MTGKALVPIVAAGGGRYRRCSSTSRTFHIDALLDASERLERGEGRAVPVGGGYEVLSTGWTRPASPERSSTSTAAAA